MRIVIDIARRVQVCTSSVCDLGYHVVCYLKYRRSVLAGPGAGRDQELARANASERDWRIVALETMPGHLHLFVNAHPSHSPSPAASQLKRLTSVR
jgi:putative transposase